MILNKTTCQTKIFYLYSQFHEFGVHLENMQNASEYDQIWSTRPHVLAFSISFSIESWMIQHTKLALIKVSNHFLRKMPGLEVIKLEFI